MNAIKSLVIATAVFISIGLTSCSPVVYSTTGQNVPLFQEKGEAVINVGYSNVSDGYDFAEGVNAQVALAIDSSVALMSSIYIMNQESSEFSGKGNYVDIGIGMFKSNPSKKFKGEIFIGAGFGSIKNSLSENEYLDVKFFKPFIQPSGGFSIKHFEIAITPRIGLVTFKSKTNGDYIPELKTTFVFEPGVTVRAGFKYVKFQYQANISTFGWSEYNSFSSYNLYGSLGVSFLMSHRWDSK